MSRPIQTSEIIFPHLVTNFSSTLSSLRRSTLSIPNRLRSITADAEFVTSVADAYGLPLVANERCGSWYIPPESKAGSAYFKSTDGHMGQWGFSLRRLNFQVLDVVGQYGGCVIVDSTRRGKSMPDALSKTVPIWCTVLNRMLFPEAKDALELYTSRQCVSESEHSQIEQRLDEFGRQFKELALNISELRSKLKKPLRPFWITRESYLPEEPPNFLDFHPIVLCTASRRVTGGEISESGYIQGAGDDSEGWSHGLTAPVFWKHKDELMSINEGDLLDLISSLLDQESSIDATSEAIMIKPTSWLFAGSIETLKNTKLDNRICVITCGDKDLAARVPQGKARHLHLFCRDKKLGSRDLRKELPKIKAFFGTSKSFNKAYVYCATGKDLSIGIILAIICLFADDQGKFELSESQSPINKSFIKQRLSWIITSFSSASPSRATLQSVNDFLLTMSVSLSDNVKTHQNLTPTDHNISNLFKSLAGEWTLDRSIVNFRNDGLAGTVNGTATFQSRDPTSEDASAEYMYSESGTFTAGPGMQMPVSRRWIWRMATPAKDAKPQDAVISVHFVKADGETEDYVYNILGSWTDEEAEPAPAGLNRVWHAKADHPCEQDFYKSIYRFYVSGVNGVSLEKFDVKHEVKGPTKDYISRTSHTRK